MPFLCWHISVEGLQISAHFPFLFQLPHQWYCSLFGISFLLSFHFLQNVFFRVQLWGWWSYVAFQLFLLLGMKSLPLWTLGQRVWKAFQDSSIAELQNYLLFHEGLPHIPDSQEELFDLRPRKHWFHFLSFLIPCLKNIYSTGNSPNTFFTGLFPLV